jgi:hypothetical protein
MTQAEKRCPRCGTPKPVSAFFKNRSKPDHLSTWCRQCAWISAREYRKRQPHRVRQQRRRHYLRHRDRIKARVRLWKAAHRDRVRELEREGYQRHREERLRYERTRRPAANVHRKASDLRHPERYRARYQVHNAVRAGRLPKPATQPCIDCGARASEYDHYAGYAAEHALDVEAVCRPCHNGRIVRRGERRRVA